MFSNEKEKGFAAVEQNELESVNGGLSRGNALGVGDFGGINLGGMIALPGTGFERLPAVSGIEVIQPGLAIRDVSSSWCIIDITDCIFCIRQELELPPESCFRF
ncbi:MAG: hypothetical protein FWC97_08130 [Treponema sp.]|nr:hypothetical protein [Treponema sp.]